MSAPHEVGLEFVANAKLRRTLATGHQQEARQRQALAAESLYAMLSGAMREAREGDERRARASIVAACQAALHDGMESSLDIMAAGGGALLLGVGLAVLEPGQGEDLDCGAHKLRMLEAALVVAEGMGLGDWKPEVVRDAAPY